MSFYLEMTTGWHTHPVIILILKWQPDGGAIRFSFPNQNDNRMEPIRFSYIKSKNSFVRRRQRPKPQINYSNQQYHLLIANKHQKLLTYYLFKGLIKDLEEWKQTDEVKMKPEWGVIRFSFYSEMITGWHTHLVVNFFKNNTLMGCYPVLSFSSIMNRIGVLFILKYLWN